ncbi:hypothetical protein P7K49_024490 [Saguinus oedipus]|uniref:LIM zinc-binding domain-containing protein n=1 Tax=Saguinus oedipus TaxID=9490 RepID=A0ABQ9UQG8_SAGOE|nr:hypothetical protein P7K49_024490 [Saguinus oedipus]
MRKYQGHTQVAVLSRGSELMSCDRRFWVGTMCQNKPGLLVKTWLTAQEVHSTSDCDLENYSQESHAEVHPALSRKNKLSKKMISTTNVMGDIFKQLLNVCFRNDALAKDISGGKLPPHIIVDESLLSYFELWATVDGTFELLFVVLLDTLLLHIVAEGIFNQNEDSPYVGFPNPQDPFREEEAGGRTGGTEERLAVCGCDLAQGGFFIKNGEYLCTLDYQRMYGTRCHGCGEFVEGEVVTALGKTYHPNCFACTICKRPFPPGDRVTFNGRDCLCQLCAQPMSSSPKETNFSSNMSPETWNSGIFIYRLSRSPDSRSYALPTCHSSLPVILTFGEWEPPEGRTAPSPLSSTGGAMCLVSDHLPCPDEDLRVSPYDVCIIRNNVSNHMGPMEEGLESSDVLGLSSISWAFEFGHLLHVGSSRCFGVGTIHGTFTHLQRAEQWKFTPFHFCLLLHLPSRVAPASFLPSLLKRHLHRVRHLWGPYSSQMGNSRKAEIVLKKNIGFLAERSFSAAQEMTSLLAWSTHLHPESHMSPSSTTMSGSSEAHGFVQRRMGSLCEIHQNTSGACQGKLKAKELRAI